MPRPKLFREDETLVKAMELFWKKGFHGTSIQDLVDFLGINRASLYGTYGGKETLFLTALRRYHTKTSEDINTLLADETSAKMALRKLFEKVVHDITSDPNQKGCLLVNSIAELLPGQGEIPDALKLMHRDYENLFGAILKEGVENGEFPVKTNIEARAAYLFSFYCGLKIMAKSNPDPAFLMNALNAGLAF